MNAVEGEPTPLGPGATWEEEDPPKATLLDADATWEEEDPPKATLLGASWRGAKAGFRWASYIIGPFAAIFLLPGLALMEFGLGTRHGFTVPDFVLEAFGFYLASAAVGGFIGVLVGLLGGLIGRGRPGSRRASWWTAANRPIRFLPWRRGTASGGAAPPGLLRRYWPIWLVVPIELSMLGALAAGALVRWQVDRRLADAVAVADQDDPYWRLEDLMANREPVADEENGALVVAEALALLPVNWPMQPPAPPGVPKPPSTGASEAFDQASATPDNVRLDVATADTLRRELEHYREAVQIARTVMYYDRGRHELEMTPTLFDNRLSETEGARDVGRLLAADAAIRAHDGDLDGALGSCRAILGTARSIGDEPFLVSQVVRCAISLIAAKSSRRALGQGEPSEEALARLQAVILDELRQPLLLYGMKGERAMLIELIRRIRDGDVPISALNDSLARLEVGGLGTRVAPWTRLMYENQMAVALEWLNRAVEISRLPAVERPALWEAWDNERNRAGWFWYTLITSGFPRLMTAGLSTMNSSHSLYEAELGATAILLAAERHRRKTGIWPASIEDIDPQILPSPPTDPCSGQPYRMEHRDGRLFVYSIGPNRMDEHGAYNVKQWGKGRLDDVGAIGWDVNLRRRSPSGDEEPAEDRPPP